ncbi:MAG: extracellular solute-binding protein [Verrucomicrobiales bacterium]
MKTLRLFTLAAAIAALSAGCGKKKKSEGPDLGHRVLSAGEIKEAQAFKHPLAEAYYKENPDFFVYASPDDLPADLKWEDGSGLPEIGSPKAKKGGNLRASLTDFPRTLRTRGPDSNGRIRNYLGDWMRVDLAHKHPNEKKYIPGLAREWAVDFDTSTVYFRLRPEARYSDGVPVTVDDFFFTFYFMRSPWIQAPYAADFFATKHTKLVKYDDHTLSITAAEKRPDLEDWIMGLMPTPRHFYKDFGEDFVTRYNWGFQPTTGPYVIGTKDIEKGRSITLRRLEDWWAKDLEHYRYRWNPDKISLKVIRDPAKAFETFKKGDLDIARLNLAEYWYSKLPDSDPLVQNGYIHKVTFFQDVPQAGYRLWLNTSKPLLDNKDIRIGLSYATNWDLVIKQFFRDDWIREQSSSDGFGEVSHPSVRSRQFSIPDAEAAFARAGFDKRGPDGILTNAEGKRLSFTISTGYKTFADALTILKQEAAKAGVDYQIEILDQTAGWKKSQEKKHEITLAGFANSPSEVYPRYWDFFHSINGREDGKPKTNTNNLSCVSIPELDPLIDEYRANEEHSEKVRLAHKIEEILDENATFVPGVYPPTYRVGFWRWVGWPDDFNVNQSEIELHWQLHWIDQDIQAETLEAIKSGKSFPPVVKDYDQFRPKF